MLIRGRLPFASSIVLHLFIAFCTPLSRFAPLALPSAVLLKVRKNPWFASTSSEGRIKSGHVDCTFRRKKRNNSSYSDISPNELSREPNASPVLYPSSCETHARREPLFVRDGCTPREAGEW